MNKDKLKKIMEKLSDSRPIFSSERDFQFELANEIKREYSNAKVFLEYFYPNTLCKHYGDILVVINDVAYPIEIKYKTKGNSNFKDKLIMYDNNNYYYINNHSAYTDNEKLYENDKKFIKEILESHDNLNFSSCFTGFTILLTNDKHYFEKYNNWEKYSSNNNIIIYNDSCTRKNSNEVIEFKYRIEVINK